MLQSRLLQGLLGVSILLLSVGASSAVENAVPNPSFEEVDGQTPADWSQQQWDGQPDYEYVEGGRTGQRCVMISSSEGADAAWQTSAKVNPNSRYRLTGWIKTENVQISTGRGAQFNIHNIQSARSRALRGDNDWTLVSMEFDTGLESDIQINCLLGGWGLATGKAWFDDLSLQLLSTRTMKPDITIDAGATGEPVSIYIYGQFIEHLGRCIYGGIWAEMLEDRKFYRAVGADRSPWKVIGGENVVKMDTEEPYVGDHTPVFTASGRKPVGMVHGGLGLVEGKEYVGRIVMSGCADSDSDKSLVDLSSLFGVKGLGPVKVSLVWGDDAGQRDTVVFEKIKSDYNKYPFRFTSGGRTDEGRLEISIEGKGIVKIGAVSLMPADNIKGMRPDTLALLKELDAPIYRWPGGNFVSGYNWRDGIGDPDKRPPRRNPAWQGIEHNDFGIDEFIAFCREIDTEPLITVNTGFGDAHSAAQEVEYVNGAADTPMGKWRAKNGHSQPYDTKWWCIGNEMYGNWQLGYMSLNHYILKHNRVVNAMRQVDPDIKLIGVGAVGSWSEGMLANCADTMDAISEHFYCQSKDNVLAHARQIPDAVRSKVSAHRRYREEIDAIQGKDIDIALDEWNYWYGPHLYGELGTRYFHKDALGIAMGLNEMIRNSEWFFMANYAQTVNVIGCIKTTKTEAAFATTGLPLKLYRRHFGTIPVAMEGDGYPMDVAAAWTADKKALTLAVVNATDEKQSLPLTINNATLADDGTHWLIQNDDPMAYNEPGKAPQVVIKKNPVTGLGDKLIIAPLSINLFKLPVK